MIGSQSILNTVVYSKYIDDDWRSRKKKVVFYDFYKVYYDNLAEKIREKDCFKMYHFCSNVKKSGLDVVHAWAEVKVYPARKDIVIFYDNGIKYCLSNSIEHAGIYKVNLEKIDGKYIESVEYYTSNKLLVEYDVEKNVSRIKKISLNGSLYDTEEIGNWAKLMYILMFYKEYDEGIYDIENIDLGDEYDDLEAIVTISKPPICKNIIELYIVFFSEKLEHRNHVYAIFTINGDSKLLIMHGCKGIKSCLAILDIDNKKINIVKRYNNYAYGFWFSYVLYNGEEVVPLISIYDDKGTRYYILNKYNSLKRINVRDIIYGWFVGITDNWYFIFYELVYDGNYHVLCTYDEVHVPRYMKVIYHLETPYDLYTTRGCDSLIGNKILYFGDYDRDKLIFKYILQHPLS